jgi:hypothetical protein
MPIMRLFHHWPEITLAVENVFINNVAAVQYLYLEELGLISGTDHFVDVPWRD